jgi:hypothetical protein
MTAGLNAHQLGIITEAARSLPPEKRDVFLQRVDAMLGHRRHGKRFDDDDVVDVCGLARFGLVVSADTAA